MLKRAGGNSTPPLTLEGSPRYSAFASSGVEVNYGGLTPIIHVLCRVQTSDPSQNPEPRQGATTCGYQATAGVGAVETTRVNLPLMSETNSTRINNESNRAWEKMSCLDQKKQKNIKMRIVSQSKYSGRDHVQGKMRIWTRSVLGFAQYFRGSYPYACDEKQDGERSRGICSCSQENMTVSFSLTLCSIKMKIK